MVATQFRAHAMSDDFYRAFEDRHRGSRELIKARQRVYLPFIEPLRSLYGDAKAIDLGCGRGEWLELLQQAGFDTLGVDLDDGMLAACRERGLNVATCDAIEALRALPDESQVVVSGFHIAEHIHFYDLQILVQEALRVLKPAGLLILETPNPENVLVGTVNFFLDPTHLKPIPPQLLSFLPEYYGFTQVKVIRLQEDETLSAKTRISLFDVFTGVSPDYAVVSQKYADTSLLISTNEAFVQEYGVTLNSLANRFDQQADRRYVAQATADTTLAEAQRASERATMAETQARRASEHAALAEAQAKKATTQAVAAETALIAINNSTSWRLTAPLRFAGQLLKEKFQIRKDIKPKAKTKIRSFVVHVALYVSRRPKLRLIALAALEAFPKLKARLKVIALSGTAGKVALEPAAMRQEDLTPLGRQNYQALKDAIERGNKEQF
jgi:SAM-dependent methyltransferase